MLQISVQPLNFQSFSITHYSMIFKLALILLNATVKKLKINIMIANKSIRLSTNYPPTTPYPSHDLINTSLHQTNQIDNSQRISTSIERVSKNMYQSPLSHISLQKVQKQQGIRDEPMKEKALFYKQSKRNNSVEGNGNQIQNKKTVNHRINFGKDRNSNNHQHQISKNENFHQSFGINLFETKEILQKMQNFNANIKKIQKRVIKLQRNSYGNGQNNENQNSICNSFRIISDQNEKQSSDKLSKIKQEVGTFKQDLKNCIKWEDMDKIVGDKIKQHSQITRVSESVVSIGIPSQESISVFKKQIEGLVLQIDEKIKKNTQFVTSIINKIQQQVKSNLTMMSPIFKSSAIKCSGSAILLRFVQSFKVRKNCTKKGQAKIVLTDNTYYIDVEGYLLDKDQHYLVDSLGNQIKLQEKHINLLRQEQILQ